MIARKYFGTDGIRGIAGKPPLDPDELVKIGKAIADYFKHKNSKKHKVLIGKDTRLSGYMIETALASGIMSRGVDVYFLGPIPTAGVAYLTHSMRANAGIMISASHNPFEDNGIKIFGADGFKLSDEKEAEIEELALENNFSEILPTSIGKAKRIDDGIGRYAVYLKNCFPEELTLEGLRIGIDCANGAGYVIAPMVCEELGADIEARGVNPNGRNINAGFGSLYPKVVRELVLNNNLNIGIALDGDADRVVLIDEEGGILDGDIILYILALYMKERGILRNDCVVATVMSNIALEKALKDKGIKLYRSGVGDRYVLAMMKELGSNLGGEQSGHIIFSDYATTGDGILTALKIMEVMLYKEKPLSELRKGLSLYPQKIINVSVRSKPEFSTIENVHKAITDAKGKLQNKGRVVVRYSGTEDKARVMVEAEDSKLCASLAKDIANSIEKEIGNV